MTRLLMALVWFVAAIWVLRLLGGTWGRAAARKVSRTGAGARQLVRDKICDTFIPRDRALVLTAGDQTYYFCSAACRARHV